ncbi:MAG: conjugal transfer protein TraF [Thermodesulfovibrionales bacterium]|jgi:conjugal transfer pilus assembly protein TraF
MKLKTLSIHIACVLTLATLTPAFAQDQPRWWEQNNQGWFFYNEEPKDEPIEKKPPAQEPPPVGAAPSASPPLFTEQMKQEGARLLSSALENPTPANIKAYMEHNKAMMQASSNFSLVWQKVLMENPQLASGTPMADSTKDLYYRENKKAEDNKLMGLAQQAGIFFIYSSSCQYCQRQAQYLQAFLRAYPFSYKAISIDGGVFPEFPDTIIDNGISGTLQVDTVPAIFLAFPPDRFDRISTGVMTPEELRRRLLWYVEEVDNSVSHSVFTGQ